MKSGSAIFPQRSERADRVVVGTRVGCAGGNWFAPSRDRLHVPSQTCSPCVSCQSQLHPSEWPYASPWRSRQQTDVGPGGLFVNFLYAALGPFHLMNWSTRKTITMEREHMLPPEMYEAIEVKVVKQFGLGDRLVEVCEALTVSRARGEYMKFLGLVE